MAHFTKLSHFVINSTLVTLMIDEWKTVQNLQKLR